MPGWLRGWGPLSVLGLVFAVLAYAVDQLHKWYMLVPFDIAARQPVEVFPGFDLVMAWNRGISYGWLSSGSQAGRWALIALSLVACIALFIWLAHQTRPLLAAAIGLVLGGALGNITDRVVHGAVADFFHLHYAGFSWYVFNLADVAIVAGVAVLLYDSIVGTGKADPAGSRDS